MASQASDDPRGASAAAPPRRDAIEPDRLRATLVRLVSRICPSWLRANADDIVQDCMVRLMDVQERSEEKPAAGTSYYWSVAYSVTVDEIRRRQRRGEVALEADQALVVDPLDEIDPERGARSAEAAAAIRHCLSTIVPQRRRALGYHLLGHTIVECARLMGLDFKQADNLIYRGLVDLRACLKAKGITP